MVRSIILIEYEFVKGVANSVLVVFVATVTTLLSEYHGEMNKDDDINTEKNKTHGELNEDDHKDKKKEMDGPPLSSSNHVFECSTTNIAAINITAINKTETSEGEEWDMITNEVTEKVRATLIDGERTSNVIKGTLIDDDTNVPIIGLVLNNDQPNNVEKISVISQTSNNNEQVILNFNNVVRSDDTSVTMKDQTPDGEGHITMKALIDGGVNGGIT